MAWLAGSLVALAVWLFVLSRRLRENELLRRMRTQARGEPAMGSRRRGLTLREQVERATAAIGKPEQARLWMRLTGMVAVLPLLLAVLLRSPLWVPLTILPYGGLYLLAREMHRGYVRQMEAQTRAAQVTLAFLLRGGATVADGLVMLERRAKAPLHSALREVNVQKRYTTLTGALEALAQKTGVGQLNDLATVMGESQRFGTPVAQALLEGVELDMKLRDARATRKYGETQLQMTMTAMLFIAMPGFGFLIFAMLVFMLHLMASYTFL